MPWHLKPEVDVPQCIPSVGPSLYYRKSDIQQECGSRHQREGTAPVIYSASGKLVLFQFKTRAVELDYFYGHTDCNTESREYIVRNSERKDLNILSGERLLISNYSTFCAM